MPSLSTATPARVKFSLPAEMFRRRSNHELCDTKGNQVMTGDETGKTLPALKVSRRGNLTRRREGGPELLNPRMRRMVELMVFGHPDDPSGTQYDIYDAAAAVGYRRKAARDLQASPIFQAAYMKALAALRNGEFAKSIKTIAEIRDDRGDNKAADRKVRLQACQVLLGEGDGGTDVTVNVRQDVVPGYVIRLNNDPQGRVIEGCSETAESEDE
jgi:hypothetical protein